MSLYPPACGSSEPPAALPIVQGQPVLGVPVAEQHHAAPRTARPTAAEAQASLPNFPPGIVEALLTSSSEAFPVRFFVVDNSGSMQAGDGNRTILDAQGRGRLVRATRWEELADTVMQVGAMALALNARTDFHLLNPRTCGQFFSMGDDATAGAIPIAGGRLESLQGLREVICGTSPAGTTPLTESVMALVSLIEPAAAKLRARGQQAVVILATDGMPNDPPSFLAALKTLQALPVWTVVRLCTDDDGVVEYWNQLDGSLEAPLEVLDDHAGEAKECAQKNGWLTYGAAMHLARTFGMHDRLWDLLDEQALLPSQVRQFCTLLLSDGSGGGVALPEPELDPRAFVTAVTAALQRSDAPPVFDPLSGRMKPWIDTAALARHLSRQVDGVASCMGPDCVVS